jgi:hypothetical protein
MARFSDDDVLGMTPIVSFLGVVPPEEPEFDPPAALAAVELLLLLLPQAARPTTTAAVTATTSDFLNLCTASSPLVMNKQPPELPSDW